jgi:hypothetical protein
LARALVAATWFTCLTGNAVPTYAASLNEGVSAPPVVAPVTLALPATSRFAVGAKAKPAAKKALSDTVQPSAEATAAVVNKMLAPRGADVGAQEDLAQAPSSTTSYDGPRIYGRGEPGGAVLGLKFAIPVNRESSDPHTTYSGTAGETGGAPQSQ